MSDIPIVQRLPAYASNGDELDLLVDPMAQYGGPLLWRCRYRSSAPDPYKWHVIGPQPLYAEDWTQRMHGGIASNTWTNSGTSLRIPAPVPGVYMAEGDTSHYANSGTSDLQMGMSVNGAAPAAAKSTWAHQPTGLWIRLHLRVPLTVAQGAYVEMQHRQGVNGANLYRQDANMNLTPVRLG